MNTPIGLWIDHERAVIVFLSDKGDETKVILSDAGKQPGRIDGERSTAPHEALLTMADDVKDRRFASKLNKYYDEVAASLHQAASLMVFGPGEAKGEFVKRLSQKMPATRSIEVETSDKMTYHQIAAKVRKHFDAECVSMGTK